MKLAKSKVFVFISLMLLSALIVLTTILALPSTNLNAEVYLANTFSDKISVKAFNDEGSEQTTSPASITLVSPDGTSTPNYTSYSYNWSNIEYFEITLDTSSLPDAKEYNYNFTVTWSPSYITNSTANLQVNHIVQEVIFSEKVSSKDDITTSFKFYVGNQEDQALPSGSYAGSEKLGADFTEYGGWGLYVFSFTYQDTIQSALFELKPDDVLSPPLSRDPVLSYQIQPSSTGLRSAYLFSVDEGFKYVNGYQIVWSGTGTAADGRSFVFFEEDKTSPTQNVLYPTTSESLRYGHTFLFDPPWEGSWTITCEIYDKDLQKTGYKAVSEQLSTVEGFDNMLIVWIVVAAAVVIAIIVGVVIYISIKKEKVY